MDIITLENNSNVALGYDLGQCKYLVFNKNDKTLSIIEDIFTAVELFRLLSNKNI